jgi:hypothetical protein
MKKEARIGREIGVQLEKPSRGTAQAATERAGGERNRLREPLIISMV